MCCGTFGSSGIFFSRPSSPPNRISFYKTAWLLKPVRRDVEQQTCQPQFRRKTKSFHRDSALLLLDLSLKVTTKGKPLHSPRARADQVNCHGVEKLSHKQRNSDGLGRLDRPKVPPCNETGGFGRHRQSEILDGTVESCAFWRGCLRPSPVPSAFISKVRFLRARPPVRSAARYAWAGRKAPRRSKVVGAQYCSFISPRVHSVFAAQSSMIGSARAIVTNISFASLDMIALTCSNPTHRISLLTN